MLPMIDPVQSRCKSEWSQLKRILIIQYTKKRNRFTAADLSALIYEYKISLEIALIVSYVVFF